MPLGATNCAQYVVKIWHNFLQSCWRLSQLWLGCLGWSEPECGHWKIALWLAHTILSKLESIQTSYTFSNCRYVDAISGGSFQWTVNRSWRSPIMPQCPWHCWPQAIHRLLELCPLTSWCLWLKCSTEAIPLLTCGGTTSRFWRRVSLPEVIAELFEQVENILIPTRNGLGYDLYKR